MTEPTSPPPPPSEPTTPPEGSSGGTGQPNTVMIVLSYLWILALIPLLVEKDDKEVQWHAKNGIVLLVLEVIVWVVLTALSITGILACLAGIASMFIWVGFVILRIVAIVKGVNGQRLVVPGVSQYADSF